MILDGFDGTIARLTGTESSFGIQLDSLVDAVVFGLVTSVLIDYWGFHGEYTQIGKVIGFIFLSAGIIRLGRFNVLKEANAYSSNIFVGFPIPFATLSICSFVLIFEDPPESKLDIIIFSLFVIIIAFLMISNIKYRTLKKIGSKNDLLVLFAFAIGVAFLIMYPSYTIPVISFFYLASPILFYVSGKIRKRKSKAVLKSTDSTKK